MSGFCTFLNCFGLMLGIAAFDYLVKRISFSKSDSWFWEFWWTNSYNGMGRSFFSWFICLICTELYPDIPRLSPWARRNTAVFGWHGQLRPDILCSYQRGPGTWFVDLSCQRIQVLQSHHTWLFAGKMLAHTRSKKLSLLRSKQFASTQPYCFVTLACVLVKFFVWNNTSGFDLWHESLMRKKICQVHWRRLAARKGRTVLQPLFLKKCIGAISRRKACNFLQVFVVLICNNSHTWHFFVCFSFWYI